MGRTTKLKQANEVLSRIPEGMSTIFSFYTSIKLFVDGLQAPTFYYFTISKDL